jgi:hypothetical protein
MSTTSREALENVIAGLEDAGTFDTLSGEDLLRECRKRIPRIPPIEPYELMLVLRDQVVDARDEARIAELARLSKGGAA